MRKKVDKMTIDVSMEIKTEIKILAIRRHVTLREWVLQAFAAAIVKEREFDRELK